MLKIFWLIILIFDCSLIVFSQNKNDLQESDLRAKVHQVNYYDVYQSPKPNQPNATKRSLSSIVVYNQWGNLRVRFELSRNGKDCFYRKTSYSYDVKNRKKTVALYQSETGENVCPNVPPVFRGNEPENLDGKISFVEKTIYEYERTGKISREIVFDRENKIVQQNNYTYDRRGEQIRYTFTQETNRISGISGKFVKTMDSRTFYRDNGKTIEVYRYEDGKLLQRYITYMDNQKRTLREESYNLKTDARNNIIKEIITARSKSFYDGNKELFSWTIYNQNGDLETQLYILFENDNELVRLEYNHRNRSNVTNQNSAERLTHYQFENLRPETIQQLKYILKFDECVESADWIPARFETNFYKFDTHNNIIQYLSQRREMPAKEIKYEVIREQHFIYYK